MRCVSAESRSFNYREIIEAETIALLDDNCVSASSVSLSAKELLILLGEVVNVTKKDFQCLCLDECVCVRVFCQEEVEEMLL